jgi:type VI protein secretion system component Hcp
MKQQNQQHTHNFYKANPNQISVSSHINYQIGTFSFTRYLDSAMTTLQEKIRQLYHQFEEDPFMLPIIITKIY